MANPVSRFATRVAYGASQLPRVAWYVGHSVIMRRLSEEVRRGAGESTRRQASTDAPVPDRGRLYADMATLFLQDLANVEAGIYPLPTDHDGSLPILLHRSRLFFKDLPEIHRRRENGHHREVLSEETRGKRPSYFLQNFHFQSGGWMTQESAQRYDTQVEVLLNGTANATRRQALGPLHEVFAGLGTGRCGPALDSCVRPSSRASRWLPRPFLCSFQGPGAQNRGAHAQAAAAERDARQEAAS